MSDELLRSAFSDTHPRRQMSSGRVGSVTRESSVEDLIETLLRWSIHEASSAEVSYDAARSVAEAEDAEWVMALACLLPDASAHDIEEVLERAAPDIGVPVVPRGHPEAVLAAVFAMVRRCVAGHLAERHLARWMHTVIGHDGAKELQLLVVLDDVYDEVEYSSDTIESVDAKVRAEAERLAHLHPRLGRHTSAPNRR